jgi:tetratricopeptide (TPR) repeat protein
MRVTYFAVFWASFVVFSCKNAYDETNNQGNLTMLEKEYLQTKADSTFQKLINTYGYEISQSQGLTEKEKHILQAIDLCASPEKANLRNVFALELIKLNPNHAMVKDEIWNIGQRLIQMNKPEAASVIFMGYKSRYTGDQRRSEAEKYILSEQKDIEKYIADVAKTIFEKPDKDGINTYNSIRYIDVCEAFVLVNPTHTMAPEYLFRAAEMARAMQDFPKMMQLYDWVYQYYPKHKNASLALFLRGFAMETTFKKPEEAKKTYQLFLQKFPQDSLCRDVRFLLENLDKSDVQTFNKIKKQEN